MALALDASYDLTMWGDQTILPVFVYVVTLAFVSNEVLAQGSVPRRALRQALVISGEEQVFVRPGQVAAGPGGLILVTDQSGDKPLLLFDSLGTRLRTIGRQGGGPGEFTNPSQVPPAVGWLGDTIWAFDAFASRLTLFSADGSVIRDTIVRPQPLPEFPEALSVVRVLSSTKFILLPRLSSSTVVALGDSIVLPVVVSDPAGTRPFARVAQKPGTSMVLPTVGGGRMMSTNPLMRLSSRGQSYAILMAGGIAVATTDSRGRQIVLTGIGLAGDTLFRRSIGFDPIPVPSRMVDSIVTGWLGRLRGAPLAGNPEQRIREQAGPITHYPPVSQLISGNDGSLWVGREEIPGRARQWLVLDQPGNPVFMTESPPGVRVQAVNARWMWGAVADSLDVISIKKWSVN